jgi:hypothetical protein
VRGAAGGDPWVSEIYEETRGRLVTAALDALGLPDDARRRQLILAWFAFTEDLVGQWAREPTMPRDELLAAPGRAGPPRSSLKGQPARDDGMRSPASPGGGCSLATTSGALLPVASIDFFTVAP